ncbi:PAS domain-containing sensor histidine kinase [Desulfosarcina variabilis]|uniref:PAS domain-containing sensor histidine kinase n=1 Tax=Desulfosarcina variabilis TaxID=2300 RepID=UPI003AFAA57F
MKPTNPIPCQDLKTGGAASPAGAQKSAVTRSGQGDICRRIIQNVRPTICFYSHTPEGVFTFLSPSAKKVFGFTPEEGIGKNWRDILVAPDVTFANVDAYDKACTKGETPKPMDAEIYHPERGPIIVEIQDGPVFDEDGRVVAIEGFIVDVTELRSFQRELENLVRARTAELEALNARLSEEIQVRRLTEDQLRASEERYRLLYNRSPIMMHSADRDGSLLNVNDQWLNVLGYVRDEVIGKNITDFLSDASRTHFLESIRPQFINSGQLNRVPYEMVKKGGGIVHALVSAASQTDHRGRITSSITVLEDVTELKRIEKEARVARERVFQAAKMVSLGTVVSGVAHEINNPISFVMLNAPALKKIWSDLVPVLMDYKNQHGAFEAGGFTYDELIKDVPEMLDLIHQGSQRIKAIVDDLKSYSRQKPKSLDEQIDINQVVENSIKFTHSLITKATDRFTTNLGRGIPPFIGNNQRIKQVLINLLVNACEALEDRNQSITIETTFDESSNRVICRVRDEGEGVSEDNLRQLTDPFFTTKRDAGGTGLGLSVSAGIIDMHGGTIDISPNPDKGITVTIGFPVDVTDRLKGR